MTSFRNISKKFSKCVAVIEYHLFNNIVFLNWLQMLILLCILILIILLLQILNSVEFLALTLLWLISLSIPYILLTLYYLTEIKYSDKKRKGRS